MFLTVDYPLSAIRLGERILCSYHQAHFLQGSNITVMPLLSGTLRALIQTHGWILGRHAREREKNSEKGRRMEGKGKKITERETRWGGKGKEEERKNKHEKDLPLLTKFWIRHQGRCEIHCAGCTMGGAPAARGPRSMPNFFTTLC